MPYNKPFAAEIETDRLCDYGCGQIAKFEFRKGKLCCSQHHNSCPSKRNTFSQTANHKENARKSLATRQELGITKSSQIKGGETRRKQGHYKALSVTMQQHWKDHPWKSKNQCAIVCYKNTSLVYQGTYEYHFLEGLETKFGIEYIAKNVARGPAIWYIDPVTSKKKLYISDFIVDKTIYEIKSSWTWNKNGTDLNLEMKNREKLTSALNEGYNVVLVLNKEEISWQ